MNELISKDNEWIIHFIGSIDRLLDNFERMAANYRPTLGGVGTAESEPPDTSGLPQRRAHSLYPVRR